MTIHFRNEPSLEDWQHIHFEGVVRETDDIGAYRYVLADHTGYVMHVTGHGDTPEGARVAAFQQIDNVVIPRMYYRADIGEKFLREDNALLKQWGWL